MSLLSVTVKKARYVGAQAQHYSTYVTLKLQNVKSTTVTVKGANPCWEQDFLFETNNVNTGLLVEVWCKGMIWDRALGYNYIPLRDIQYSNEEGNGQWVSLDAEILMREGEVIGTAGPTGDSLLLDCRFELPFGRYDPPSGWKALLAPDSERRSGPRSLGDEDNTDWLPLGHQSLPDYWSGEDAENTDGDALQRKLERLNSTIVGHDEQSRRQYQFYGQAGYSEDSDYTSDLNYPIGQHPNSSASQFKSAAQLMRTPERSLETSRENSYERDDAPGQGHLQGSHHLPANHHSQQGRVHQQSYNTQQSFRNYNETDGEPLYYNSRPRDYKEYSSQEWYGNQYSKKDPMYEQPKPYSGKRAGRRPSLERQTTLYDDQYFPDQQYYDGTERQQQQQQQKPQHQPPQRYETYTAQNFGDFYSQDYGYQNESYGQEEEDKQWDSGGYYYRDNFEISPSDNYQNVINRARSSKKLPQVSSYNSSEDASYYTPQRGMSYEDEPVDNNTTISASTRRKLLKQQRQSSENFTSTTNWTSEENWPKDNDCNYYDDYNTANTNTAPPVVPPAQPHKKRTLPQIRVPSRNRMSAVSLPQIPGPRQLPNPPVGVNKQRTSAPVSRTTSNDYDQSDVYGTGSYNENYNYAYESNDNLPNDKFGDYPTEIRTSGNYQSNYDTIQNYANNYPSVDNYPGTIENYRTTNENFQNYTAPDNLYNRNQPTDEYYSPDYYEEEDDMKKYYETDVTQGLPQKSFLDRRAISPFTQQNTDSLESKDDELKNESFETAYESICSSIPVQKQSTEYSSIDAGMEYKPEPPKQQEQQSTGVLGGLLGQLTRSPSSFIQQQQQNQQQQQQQTQKTEQRSRDQSNLLSNPALTAMNVTKGLLSSLTNVVNNTVQNINKQQQKPQQQPESQAQQVQRIQVTKRGSLKQEEVVENQTVMKNRQNSFDSQVHDYRIPEEPEFLEEKEDEYYNQQREYYQYNPKEYYEEEANEYQRDENVSELDLLQSRLESENLKKRTAHLKHQDTIESEGKMSDINNRNYLREQDSLDSCAEEIIMHNSGLINGHRASPDLDRYEDTRTGVIEPLRSGSPEGNRLDSPRKRGRDNSLIEPYHPSVGQEVPKGYSPSPPAIQKQQSVDLEGIEEVEEEEEEEAVPEDAKLVPEEIKKVEPEPEEPVKTVVPERRKMTAKERWHRAYNVVVQQLNVSFFSFLFSCFSLIIKRWNLYC